MGEPLEQLGRAAFHESRPSMGDEVLLQPGRLQRGSFDRERDARISSDVSQLSLIGAEMSRDDLVVLKSDPDTRHLGRAIRVERHEVREGADSISSRALSDSSIGFSVPYPGERRKASRAQAGLRKGHSARPG